MWRTARRTCSCTNARRRLVVRGPPLPRRRYLAGVVKLPPLLQPATAAAAGGADGDGGAVATAGGGGEGRVYISRAWLHRMAYVTEPGLVVNSPCVCLPRQRATACFRFGSNVPDAAFPPRAGAGAGAPPDRRNRHFHGAVVCHQKSEVAKYKSFSTLYLHFSTY